MDSKAAIPNSKPLPRYHSLLVRVSRRRHHPIRFLRSRLFHRLALLLALLSCAQLYLLHKAYHEALIQKFSPTLFARSSPSQDDILALYPHGWRVDVPEDQDGPRRRLLDSRGKWKKLGSGYEGDTFASEASNSVIKVFRPGRSPLRNCVPGTTPELEWPPEIPASLLLGGLHDSGPRFTTAASSIVPDHFDFVPVLDYFHLAATPTSQAGEWYLVTPFLHSGTLEHLAKRLRAAQPPLTPDEVDARFRPSFNRVLQTLETMHSQYELCHDDIKMDNLFVTDFASSPTSTTTARDTDTSGNLTTSSALGGTQDSHWLVADLGNARQPSHEYHSSLLWTHDNGQHADCRVNDLVRLVKTYMMFLRSAAAGGPATAGAFRDSFLGASAPWSQLYWYTVNAAAQADGLLGSATAATHVQHMSTTSFAPRSELSANAPPGAADQEKRVSSEGGGKHSVQVQRLVRPRSSSLVHRLLSWGDPVEAELHKGMSVSEKWAVIFGRMWILKTPSKRCGH